MAFFTENPFPIIMLGLLFVGGFGVFGFLTRNRLLLVLAAFSLLITIGLVALERWIVTDREQLRHSVFDLARLVENNDVSGAKLYFSNSRPDVLMRMEQEMPDYKFRYCRISAFRPIAFDNEQNPTKAKVDFTVQVNVDATKRYQYDGAAMRGVTLTFEKESDGFWRVIDYQHYDTRQTFGL